MSSETITKIVPIFVAAMVWLVRLLIIGTFSLAGERLFTTAQANSYQKPAYNQNLYNQPRPQPQPQQQPRPAYQSQSQNPRPQYNQPTNQPVLRPASQINRPVNAAPSSQTNFRPAPKPVSSQQTSFIPPEPTYHPVSYEARTSDSTDRRYDA
jgi:hypothetical protein